jgi:predicted metal-binding protein
MPMTTTITVCDSCKRGSWTPEAPSDGARLAELIEAAAARLPEGALAVRRHACLMGCAGACNVAIQAPGKMAYTLGRLPPEAQAAEGVVAWAALHGRSRSGVVDYRLWPEAVRDRFVTRHPPLEASG